MSDGITRRSLWVFALLPLGLVGGIAIRAKEKVAASPIIPKRWRSQYIEYLWTDGVLEIKWPEHDLSSLPRS